MRTRNRLFKNFVLSDAVSRRRAAVCGVAAAALWGAAGCASAPPSLDGTQEPPSTEAVGSPTAQEGQEQKAQAPEDAPEVVERVAEATVKAEVAPKPYPGAPSEALREALREYLETPLWKPEEAQARLGRLAASLEGAGYEAHHTMALVRDAFPLEMPPKKRMRGAVVEVDPETYSKSSYPIYLPEGYTPDREWPLHVTLHGGSASGFNCRIYWNTERRPKHLKDVILLCPSTPRGHFHSLRGELDMLSALHRTLREYNVDTDRISLDGLSTGGTAAWILGAKHSPRWRSVTVRGGGSILSPRIKGNGYPSFHNLARVPVLILHGAEDTLIKVGAAQGGAEFMERFGYSCDYWEDPKAGHIFFTRRNADVMAWLRDRRRAPLPKAFSHLSGIRSAPAPMLYWVHARGGSDDLEANIEGNTITLQKKVAPSDVTVFVPDELLADPSAPVQVVVNGVVAFEGEVPHSLEASLESYWRTHDHKRLFSRAVRLSQVGAPEPIDPRDLRGQLRDYDQWKDQEAIQSGTAWTSQIVGGERATAGR